MENHHFQSEIQYKWQFSIAMLVYQRVSGGLVRWENQGTKWWIIQPRS